MRTQEVVLCARTAQDMRLGEDLAPEGRSHADSGGRRRAPWCWHGCSKGAAATTMLRLAADPYRDPPEFPAHRPRLARDPLEIGLLLGQAFLLGWSLLGPLGDIGHSPSVEGAIGAIIAAGTAAFLAADRAAA